MLRKIKRTHDYEIKLEITNDEFLNTPRPSQQSWMLNRLMKEYSDDLSHLDEISQQMLIGAESTVSFDRAQARLTDEEIMEDWQIPIMKRMAEFVTSSEGDVLEIGMGRGVASDFIQSFQPNSHTLIECNDSIVENFPKWQAKHPGRTTRMVHGMWQDVWQELGGYDGILFHTYPLSDEEFVETVVQSSTFAEHFFEPAAKMLKDGGVLTYLTNENDSLSRAHQRSLLNHFSKVSLSVLEELNIPENTHDSCWLPRMIMVEAIK